MILVNIFQVAMLGKKKTTQQPFALTLFTSCFLKLLRYVKTLTSQISCCLLLQHFDYNHLMPDISSQLLLSMLISLSASSLNPLSQVFMPSYLLTENTIALLGEKRKKGLANTIAPVQNTCSSSIFHYACLRFYNHCAYVTTYKCRQNPYIIICHTL